MVYLVHVWFKTDTLQRGIQTLDQSIYSHLHEPLSSATPLPLSPVSREAMPHNGHVWSAKRRYNAHLLSYLGGKMWPNCLKYRQGRSVSCVGFCLPKVSRLGSTSLESFFSGTKESAEGNVRRVMAKRRMSKRKREVYVSINLLIYLWEQLEAMAVGTILPQLIHHTQFPTWYHRISFRCSKIGLEQKIHLHGVLEWLSPVSPSYNPFKSSHLPSIDNMTNEEIRSERSEFSFCTYVKVTVHRPKSIHSQYRIN